jgi:hypothetical protein
MVNLRKSSSIVLVTMSVGQAAVAAAPCTGNTTQQLQCLNDVVERQRVRLEENDVDKLAMQRRIRDLEDALAQFPAVKDGNTVRLEFHTLGWPVSCLAWHPGDPPAVVVGEAYCQPPDDTAANWVIKRR